MNSHLYPLPAKPDLTLFISSGCVHCPGVLKSLTDLLKRGDIARLEIVNLDVHPEIAQKNNVRTVPWIRYGEDVITGARTTQQLHDWLNRSNSVDSMILRLNELLTDGQLAQAIKLVETHPDYLNAILQILSNPNSKINVRVGISVIMEHLQGSEALVACIPELTELVRSPEAPVRSDAAHYLALTESAEAIPILESLLNDESADVREIATDGLEALRR